MKKQFILILSVVLLFFSSCIDGILNYRAMIETSFKSFLFCFFAFGISLNIAAQSGWVVDHGPYKVNGNEITASPASDGITSYYVAPSQFRGNWSNIKSITFDKNSWGGSYYDPGTTGDIILVSNNKSASINIVPRHDQNWVTFTIDLYGSEGWKLENANSLSEVLGNVTNFLIRAEYGAGTDYSILRNVRLVPYTNQERLGNNQNLGSGNRVNGNSGTRDCFALLGLGKLLFSLEIGAHEGYRNNDWMTPTIDYAIGQAEATGCISTEYLKDLKKRISWQVDSRQYLAEIKSYSKSVEDEARSNCNCNCN